VGLDIHKHQFCARVTIHIWGCGGIVHAVGQIPAEHGIHPPADQLLDTEGSVEDAHVGVHTHDHHVWDFPFPQHFVDLGTLIADHIQILIDEDGRMLASPEVFIHSPRIIVAFASAVANTAFNLGAISSTRSLAPRHQW